MNVRPDSDAYLTGLHLQKRFHNLLNHSVRIF